MNINLHFNRGFINLGLEKMKGLFKSNECLELLSKKCNFFNLKLSTVMKKKSNDSPTKYKLCFAHATHLAVIDVICKK